MTRAQRFKDNLALSSFIEWLEKQPPRKRYEYLDRYKCVVAQYAISCGLTDYWDMPAVPRVDWNYEIAGPHPNTFGGALKRARTMLAEQEIAS